MSVDSAMRLGYGLPYVVVRELVSYLPLRDLCALRRTNRELNEVVLNVLAQRCVDLVDHRLSSLRDRVSHVYMAAGSGSLAAAVAQSEERLRALAANVQSKLRAREAVLFALSGAPSWSNTVHAQALAAMSLNSEFLMLSMLSQELKRGEAEVRRTMSSPFSGAGLVSRGLYPEGNYQGRHPFAPPLPMRPRPVEPGSYGYGEPFPDHEEPPDFLRDRVPPFPMPWDNPTGGPIHPLFGPPGLHGRRGMEPRRL